MSSSFPCLWKSPSNIDTSKVKLDDCVEHTIDSINELISFSKKLKKTLEDEEDINKTLVAENKKLTYEVEDLKKKFDSKKAAIGEIINTSMLLKEAYIFLKSLEYTDVYGGTEKMCVFCRSNISDVGHSPTCLLGKLINKMDGNL